MISYECQVEYVCPRCDATDVEIIAAPVADYILEHDNPDARYAFAQIEVVCGHCDKELTLMVENNDDMMSASIPAYPGTKVSVSEAYMVESEDFLPELDFPPDPATFLISAMVDVHEVREATKHMGQTSIVTRMAFVQLFAAFEAFLSDTLIGIVLENPEVFKRALAGIKELREMKLDLITVANEPDIVRRMVAAHLRDLIYHNFGKLIPIWREVLDFELFPKEVRARMFKRVQLRHDCVHRNGKDKEGNVLTDIDADFVDQFEADLRTMMSWTDAAVLQHGKIPWDRSF